MNAPDSNSLSSLWSDTRGTVMLEYTILMGTVAIGSAIAFISVGVAFVNNFDLVRGLILCLFP
jgi:Flp pilus assembly pilin Flp